MSRFIGSVTFLTLFLVGCGGGEGTPTAIEVGASRGMAITSGPPPGGTVGVAYNSRHCHRGGCGYQFALSASGGIGSDTWGWAAAPGSSLPPGLSLTGNLISGTPPAGSVGSYSVIVTATDSGTPPGAAMQPYTITIVNPPPPVVSTSPPPQGATRGQPYSFTFSASGPTAVTFSATGNLPPGLAPVTPDGVLAGTPTATGSFPIVLQAADAAGQKVTQKFTVEVFAHGFALVGQLHEGRVDHTATLLDNGLVLITGGLGTQQQLLSSAELFDPVKQTFTSTASMNSVRAVHTATLFCDPSAALCANPKVLIAGGYDGSNVLASAEIFDPASPGFTATGSMSNTRLAHTATLLPGGKVLIAGGTDGSGTAIASAELYDPVAGTFAATGSMTAARSDHTATLLTNGKVLIAGGCYVHGPCGPALASAELYDPASGTFTATGSMSEARGGHTATLLPNGQVLIGGTALTGLPATFWAELYDPASGSFAATANPLIQREFQGAVLLPTGSVLIAGGSGFGTDAGNVPVSGVSLKHADLFDPTTATFSSTGALQIARSSPTMTGLGTSGQVLVVGGGGQDMASAEVYQ